MAEMTWRLIAPLFVIYLVLVRLLRYRRCEAIKRKYGMLYAKDFASLTSDQAQDILAELVEMEFPKLMGFSIVFALFKTYGIPSVSSLLVKTGELASPDAASKRTADTGVLLLEFCLNKPTSDRAVQAIARMNYLHSRYVKAGKISNEDMLYTLSVFALEPLRWVNKYEWRELSDLEMCASGTFWKSMGDKMEIDFAVLPSGDAGWTDGLHWLNEVRVWSEQYENDHMVPNEINRTLAIAHLDVIFLNLPKSLDIMAKHVVSAIVGDRLRHAMMLPTPPWIYISMVENFFWLRKLLLRHLALPRPEFMRKQYISTHTEGNGRFSSREYLSHPWYVRPTLARRWGPRALVTRMLGRKVPGDDGNKYLPEGYIITEVGPTDQCHLGASQMRDDMKRIESQKPGGCPFSPIRTVPTKRK